MFARSMNVLSLWLMIVSACGNDARGSVKLPNFDGGANSDEPVLCGSADCKAPAGFTGQLCCYDMFASTCGQKTSQGPCGMFPVQQNANCPDGTLVQGSSAMFVRGCCLTDGSHHCGIDLAEFGVVCSPLSDFDDYPGSSTPTPTNCDGTTSM